MSVPKKLLKISLIFAFVFVVGGVGGVVVRDRVMPALLASFPSLSRMPLFQNLAGNVTIIEKKEQLVVREDDSVDAIVSQPATAVVNIIISNAKGPATLFQPGKSQTGVLLTNDGLVVTYGNSLSSALDAGDAFSYRVLLFDGTSHEAKVLGEDPLTNLVYFKIADGGNFPAIALANSDDSRPGKKLVAIGNSFEEYQNRFSIGVLSHRNKTFNLSAQSVASTEKWEGVFEMDLPGVEEYIGGPAVNFRGEMVGIFGDVLVDGKKTYFLLPANTIRESMRLAVEDRLSARPSFGAYYLTLTKASSFGVGEATRDRGALIYSPSGRTGLAVLSGSSAEKAGLRVGDIVIAVNGKEINLDNPLSVAIGRLGKGETAELLIVRNEKEMRIPVTLQ